MLRCDAKRRWVPLLVVVVVFLIAVGFWALRASTERGPLSRPSAGSAAAAPCEGRGIETEVTPERADSTSDSHEIAAAPNEPSVSAFAEAIPDEVDFSGADGLDEAPSGPMATDATVPPEPGFVIGGKVVRSDGTPYDGEPVRTDGWPEITRVQVTGPGCERSCPIDPEGRFECAGLEAASYIVRVADTLASDRLLSREAQVEVGPDASSGEVVLVLGEEVPVTVLVLNQKSLAPVSDCRVAAEPMGGGTIAYGIPDEQGFAELKLIAGQYLVYVPRSEDGLPTETGLKLLTVKTTSEPIVVELRIPPSRPKVDAVIRGVLVDSAGNPIKGYVDIEFAVVEGEIEPAESFPLLRPGYCPPEGCFGRAEDVSGRLGRWFLWRSGDIAESLTIVLEPMSEVVGRVTDAAGKAMPSVYLQLQMLMANGRWRSVDQSLCTLTTDGRGGFQFENVPAGLQVKVFAYRGTVTGQSEPFHPEPGRIRDVGTIVVRDRKLDLGTVQGHIVNESGQPIALRTLRAKMPKTTEWFRTDADGRFVLDEVPVNGPVTIAVPVPGYGTWLRTAFADDADCDFVVCPQGWGALEQKAIPLVVDRWFNHVPMTWDQLRGRVVLLTFWDFESSRNLGLSATRNLCEEFSVSGLVAIAVCQHAPDGQLADHRVGYVLERFKGVPIAGCLDADPNMVADLMLLARPSAAEGATHWLYQVHDRPAHFLIDKQGIVRCCPGEAELREWVQRLLGE